MRWVLSKRSCWLCSLAYASDFSAAGVVAISFWPPDGHIRILMTQECGRKSRWHKKLVKPKVWKRAKPFGLLGESYVLAANEHRPKVIQHTYCSILLF